MILAYIIKPVKISLFGLHRYVREQIGQRIRSSTGTKKSISNSCELLDNIFPLIDDISFDEKVKRCRKMLKDLEKTETS